MDRQLRPRLAFACPPDCGRCCSHLERAPVPGDDDFRDLLREHGVYHCAHRGGSRIGLSVSNAEAAAMRVAAKARGLRLPLHPRAWMLAPRRRLAVVLDWHMPRVRCPMLDGFACAVYDARPLVCRAYPVLGLGSRALAPECPKVPAPASALREERSARRAIDHAHATLDALANGLMASGERFASGLPAREAAARLKRYRLVPVEEFARARATP